MKKRTTTSEPAELAKERKEIIQFLTDLIKQCLERIAELEAELRGKTT